VPVVDFANSINSSRVASAAQCGGDGQHCICAA
jgi:hypothetical protein